MRIEKFPRHPATVVDLTDEEKPLVENLKKMTRDQLRAMCKRLGIRCGRDAANCIFNIVTWTVKPHERESLKPPTVRA